MSDKTEKFRWLPWAIAVVVVLGIGVLGSNYANWYVLDPWNSAKTVVTVLSIDAFSAGIDYNTFVQDATDPHWNFRLSAFAMILLTFVIGPSLWVYAEIKNQNSSSEDVLKKGIAWYVGVILVVAGLQVVPATVIKGIVFQNTWDNAAESKEKDQLRSDLLKLGYKALEFYHLPHENGGGGNSFHKRLPNSDKRSSIQVADLKQDVRLSGNSYILEVANSDSMIIIRGIGTESGGMTDFNKADAVQEKIEIALQVTPPAKFEYLESNTK